MTDYQLFTLAERPDLADAAQAINNQNWPQFMLNDPVANENWWRLTEQFSDFQFVLLDGETVATTGNSVPLVWDGTISGLPPRGWDGGFEQAVAQHEAGLAPNTLMALSITVDKPYQGKGVSAQAVRAMKTLAARAGFGAVIAPVRPSQKALYPLIPLANYIKWRRADGLLFDAWLRTHEKVGADLLMVAPDSMVILGSIERWERWTGMHFPESGRYIIPGALAPMEINATTSMGRYVEGNVWMRHKVDL